MQLGGYPGCRITPRDISSSRANRNEIPSAPNYVFGVKLLDGGVGDFVNVVAIVGRRHNAISTFL